MREIAAVAGRNVRFGQVVPRRFGAREHALEQSLVDLRLNDHRRAFHAYAVHRGINVRHHGPQMYLSGQDFSVSVQFNQQNLVTAMSANLGGQ